MIMRICLALCLVVVPLQTYAGQAIIRETETGIVVEYTPDEEDSKAVVQQEKSREAEEEAKAALEEKRAAQRAKSEARKAAREKEGDE